MFLFRKEIVAYIPLFFGFDGFGFFLEGGFFLVVFCLIQDAIKMLLKMFGVKVLF